LLPLAAPILALLGALTAAALYVAGRYRDKYRLTRPIRSATSIGVSGS
jgi:hypothetical protein